MSQAHPYSLARWGAGPPTASPTLASTPLERPIARCQIGYLLFLLVNFVLLVRPSEIVPALDRIPIYQFVILACLLTSLPVVLEQLTLESLFSRPITLFVLCLLPAALLSHLSHLYFGGVLDAGREFGKLVIYYLLLVGLVNTPSRLRQFMVWVFLLVIVLTTLALLEYHRVIDIPALREMDQRNVDPVTGVVTYLQRMRSTGIFNDPNDLCLVLVLALNVAFYRMLEGKNGDQSTSLLMLLSGGGFLRVIAWMLPIGFFGYALAMTRSRGGFLSMLAGGMTILISRFGLRKTIPLAIIVLPAMFVIFAGRQTEISASTGTGQERIQIWGEGLSLLREAPLFGIGMNEYEERVGLVAHNSYVHAYTELGIFGGMLFMGAFLIAGVSLRRAASPGVQILDPQMARLRAYLLAMLTAYAVGIFTLSRPYTVLTYVILGMAAAFLRVAPIRPRSALPRFTGTMLFSLLALSALFIVAAYVLVNLLAKWSGA